MAADPKLDRLRSVPLFSGLGSREIERLGQLVDEVEVPAGHVLMRQGDRGNEMFVLVSGKVSVERAGRALGERGAGSVLGEIALLAEMPRTATVIAIEPSRMFVVGHREFHSLMDQMPSVRTSVLEVLASRIAALDPDAS